MVTRRVSTRHRTAQMLQFITYILSSGECLRDLLPQKLQVPLPQPMCRDLDSRDTHLEARRYFRIGSLGFVSPQVRLQSVKQLFQLLGCGGV